MQKKVLLVTPGLCGVCKNLSILLAIRQCGVRNKISELFLLCFLLGAALESLYMGLYKSMYNPSVRVTFLPMGHAKNLTIRR